MKTIEVNVKLKLEVSEDFYERLVLKPVQRILLNVFKNNSRELLSYEITEVES